MSNWILTKDPVNPACYLDRKLDAIAVPLHRLSHIAGCGIIQLQATRRQDSPRVGGTQWIRI